jgi:hypothetical protein
LQLLALSDSASSHLDICNSTCPNPRGPGSERSAHVGTSLLPRRSDPSFLRIVGRWRRRRRTILVDSACDHLRSVFIRRFGDSSRDCR